MSRLLIHSVILLALTISSIADSCTLPLTFDCSDPINPCQGYSEVISLPMTRYQCPDVLNLTADTLNISGTFTGLVLTGEVAEISNITVSNSLNLSIINSISMSGNINVGSYLLVTASNTCSIGMFEAILTAEKLVMLGADEITIDNSTIHMSWQVCFYERIQIAQFIEAAQIQVTDYISQDTISKLNCSFLAIINNISIQSSTVVAASSALLGQNNINIVSSNINGTALGCRSNTGPGRGAIIQYQTTHCTSGASGCGSGVLSDYDLCSTIIQYFLFLNHAFPYLNKGAHVQTGSGGYGYNLQNNGRGSGGGILLIFCEENITLNSSNLTAAGGDVYESDSLSAGSGGTIFITSNVITGNGYNNITASGGNSYNDLGAGAGGIVKLSAGTVNREYPASLFVYINQGYQPSMSNYSVQSNGIFYGPRCYAGQQRLYLSCNPCPANYYSTIGDQRCRVCPSLTTFPIDESTTNKSLLSQCYKIKSQSPLVGWFTPGDIHLITIPIYIALLVLFTIVGAVLKKKNKKQRMASEDQFHIEDIFRDIQKPKTLPMELRKATTIKTNQLLYHVHRISCFGNNTKRSPWVLPSRVPEEVRKYVLTQVFASFAESFSDAAKWGWAQTFLCKLCKAIYPLHWYYLDKVKKNKYKKLLGMLQSAKDYNLINSYDYEDKSMLTIKFSKNKDYTNCYLDFFLYDRADPRYFRLTSPFLIYLSGQGNFIRPFYLQQGDIFFRLLFFVINRNLAKLPITDNQKQQLFNRMVSQKKRIKNCSELNRFLRKFNAIACTVDIDSTNGHLVDVLWSLSEFVQQWNQKEFNEFGVQMDLVMVVSQMLNRSSIDNEVNILTPKNKSAFADMVVSRIEQVRNWKGYSIKLGLFVYNPDQQIPREEELLQQVRETVLEGSEDENSMSSGEEEISEMARQSLIKARNSRRMNCYNRLRRLLGLARYLMLSHQNSRYDEYTIKFLQSLFISLQTMLVCIWSIKIQIPYVLVNLVCPFVGIVWFVSDSYGIGKLYMILNAMCLANESMTLIVYCFVESYYQDAHLLISRTVICCCINIFIVLIMMFVGSRAITLSKKLSFQKEQPKIQAVRVE